MLVDGEPFEVTTLRHDVETDGRRAVVRFGRNFEEDALRRDFTMNALSVARDGRLFDCTHGVEDIARRHVRFIGEARQRIREDYLRILRFFRFHAAFGEGAMDAEAFPAVIAERDGLSRLSRERVRAEILKLLAARRGGDVAEDVAGTGILGPLLGGAPYTGRLHRLAAIEAANGADPDPILRLAALRVQVVEDADMLHTCLRLSNAYLARLSRCAQLLAQFHNCAQPPAQRELRAALLRHGRQGCADALRLVWAESRADPADPDWRAALTFAQNEPEPRPPFKGADLLSRGLPHGPRIGRILAEFERQWVEADLTNEPELLESLLNSAISRAP